MKKLLIKDIKLPITSSENAVFIEAKRRIGCADGYTLSVYKKSLEHLLSYDFDEFLLGHGAGLMKKPFLTRLLELTNNALAGKDKELYAPFSSDGFENPGSVSYCEGKPYEAGKCGIIFNLNNL